MGAVPRPIPLAEVVARLEPGARLVSGDRGVALRGVTHDSRRVAPGDLFVAVPGLQRDGLAFVADAVARGASAVLAESAPAADPGVPLVLVPSARRALADAAVLLYGDPSAHLSVVGVTGTDGKTSTTYLLSAILEARGLRTGWLTTVSTRVGGDPRPNAADHTTPEAPVVQRTLAEMVAAGVQVAIVETSSHALELERVRGTRYRVGVFTNLSPEHLNFHGSMAAYRAAKARLFEALPADGLAVLNADDPNSAAMRAATRAAVLTYGLDAPADLRAVGLDLAPSGTRFTLQPGGHPVASRLVGRFNVANWLAAYGAATFFGATPEHLVAAARQQAPVPGRMNLVDAGQPFAVVVDFAHTPQALEKALDTLRGLASGRVLLVFGLAGGRDAHNRPVMGGLAARKADLVVVSTDDPGDEDPAAIAEQVVAGAREAGGGRRVQVELDRRLAIRRVLAEARPGDVVLLAGKGHEERMVVAGERLPWNDARVTREELARLAGAPPEPAPRPADRA